MSTAGRARMQLLELTLETTARNLALDEWLLEQYDAADEPGQLLRIWENPAPAVILGRSSRYESEINRARCRQRGVEILRRVSGGASVVIGPGCLMYSVVLDTRLNPALQLLDQTHHHVMSRMEQAVRQCGVDAVFQGTCDLTVQGRKFSGNSLRCKRNGLLYHGTLLYDFPLELIGECLGQPPRQPEYRAGRNHRDFVTNLGVSAGDLRAAIVDVWGARTEPDSRAVDLAAVDELASHKYTDPAWTGKL